MIRKAVEGVLLLATPHGPADADGTGAEWPKGPPITLAAGTIFQKA